MCPECPGLIGLPVHTSHPLPVQNVCLLESQQPPSPQSLSCSRSVLSSRICVPHFFWGHPHNNRCRFNYLVIAASLGAFACYFLSAILHGAVFSLMMAIPQYLYVWKIR